MNPIQKKMRVTVDGKPYEVVVEMLSEVPGHPSMPPMPAYAPVPVSAPVSAPAPSAAPVPKAAAPKGAGSVVSPLSGTVVTVHVKEGQAVTAGEVLVTLEAMKMNTAIRAPSAGTVRSIHCSQGAAVEEGAVLVVVE